MYTSVYKRPSHGRSNGRSADKVDKRPATYKHDEESKYKSRGPRKRFRSGTYWVSITLVNVVIMLGMGAYLSLTLNPVSDQASVITINTTSDDGLPSFTPSPGDINFDELEYEDDEPIDDEYIKIEEDENGEFILPDGIKKEDLHYTKRMEVAVMGNFEEQNLYLSLLVMTDILHQHMPICIFTGRVLLISNVALESEYTESNYEAFGELLDSYQDRGLDVFAFPCNEFDNAEPGTDEDILNIVNEKYSPRLFIMAKMLRSIADNDLFRWLRARTPEDDFLGRGPILENFSKFLVDRQGHVVKRYGAKIEMDVLRRDIEAIL